MSRAAEAVEGPVQRKLGRYVLRYRVAEGGMAAVYLAQLSSGSSFRKWVAVKTIHPHIARDRQFIEMFLNEARLAARIDHPNVCTVFDFGEEAGTSYIAMEYLHGEALSAILQRAASKGRVIPRPLACRIIADAARGLHAAHELRAEDGTPAGVVHRDVSPQNLFVLYGGASKVVDFGVAKSNEYVGERTQTGQLKGKLAYMSPEQIRQTGVDRRTDIWALGAVLWEMTLGERIFKRTNEALTIMAVLQEPIRAPTSVRADYPPALEAIVMRALERDVELRYRTALELARDLEAYLARFPMPAGHDEVAALMQQMYGDAIAAREDLLRRGGKEPDEISLVDAGAPEVVEQVSTDLVTFEGSGVQSNPGEPVTTRADRPSVLPEEAVALTRRRASNPGESPPHAPTPLVHAAPIAVPGRSKRGVLIAAVVLLPLLGAVVTAYALIGRAPPTRPANAVTTAPPLLPPPLLPPPLPTLPTATNTPDPVPAVPAVPVSDVPTVAAAEPSLGAAADAGDRRRRRTSGSGDAGAATVANAGDTGFLNLLSDAPSDVFEGTRRLGSTPLLDFRLPAGAHSLRVVPRDGGEEHRVSVDVQAGATSMLNIRSQ